MNLARRAALASVACAVLLGGLKAWAAWRTGSVAVLASLADSVLDLPLIYRAFPDVPWVFVYRQPVEVLASHAGAPLPEADPGTPPLTTPFAFLMWQARRQSGVLAAGVFFGILGAVCQAALPYVLGRAIDDGLEHGLTWPLLRWCLVLLGIGVVSVIAG